MSSQLAYNPYDYLHPVTDIQMFAGRERELEEVRYYLDQAETAPRPFNIALLGPRAAGKTSLLNVIEHEANKRGFCTVRLNLDEDDARSQQTFFLKLFDGILTKACEQGAFGGTHGKTYDVYLDMTNALMVPSDPVFCPFLFPVQCAKARSAGNFDAPVSEPSLRTDLNRICQEVQRTFVILIDEGSVLARSQVHLQKLRNLFMNAAGYMIVIAGLPNLFEMMDDVFSPIVRDFKKITVDAFRTHLETRECITKPLEKIGVRVHDVFEMQSYYDLQQIHRLSGGKPYEIQLICHTMFRRLQTQQARRLKLDLSVLEDVRKQLETSQNVSVRPILTAVRALSRKQLHALRILCECEHATFEQASITWKVFTDADDSTGEDLHAELQAFNAAGIITVDEGERVKFAGDDFDRIYVKYYAQEMGVSLPMHEMPIDVVWHSKLYEYTALQPEESQVEDKEEIGFFESTLVPVLPFGSGDVDVPAVYDAFFLNEETTDAFVESPMAAASLYRQVWLSRDGLLQLVHARVRFNWLNVSVWYLPDDSAEPESVASAVTKLVTLKERVEGLGGEMEILDLRLPLPDAELLDHKVQSTANARVRRNIGSFHAEQVRSIYERIKQGSMSASVDDALTHAELACRYDANLSPDDCNNIGYLFMSIGDAVRARGLFEYAISRAKKAAHASKKESAEQPVGDEVFILALALYNLAILDARSGELASAVSTLEQSIRRLRTLREGETGCLCLWVPLPSNGHLTFEEQTNVDLLETARVAKRNVARMQRSASV